MQLLNNGFPFQVHCRHIYVPKTLEEGLKPRTEGEIQPRLCPGRCRLPFRRERSTHTASAVR